MSGPGMEILSNTTGMNIHHNVVRHYGRVLERILRTQASRALFHAVNTLNEASSKSRRDKIPTTVTFVIGNHDRALHVFPSLRKRIASFVEKPAVAEICD